MKHKQTLAYVIIGISLFVLSVGVSYLITSSLKPGKSISVVPTSAPGKPSKISMRPTVDPSLPRTEVCPINGLKYTESERKVWETHSPLAAMIENSLDSRPQSGLSTADLIYEAVAEGGITRFMGIFYCGLGAGGIRLAPVRSARIYFTKLVTEYDALYNHVGGAGNCDDPTVAEAAKALCFIRRNKIKDLDQFGLDFKACHRLTNRLDHEVAYEHTMACFTDELYKVAEKRGWTNAWDKNFVAWKFKEDSADHGKVTDISFVFWKNKPDYDVAWKYDPATNAYLRSTGGQPQIDLDTQERLIAKSIIVQLVKESGPLDEHMHMYYENIGSGKALIFQDGKIITGTWSKTSPVTRTKFFGADKKEIEFNRGQTWIELVPATNKIEYNQ